MKILFEVLIFLAELAIIVWLCLWFHKRGFKRGRDDGYKLGRVDADNWWLDVEQQVDQARQKMWREEATPKKEWP